MAFAATRKWLRMTWAEQPVLVVSALIGVAGPLWVYFSPYTQAAKEYHDTIPKRYPYPQLEGVKTKAPEDYFWESLRNLRRRRSDE